MGLFLLVLFRMTSSRQNCQM